MPFSTGADDAPELDDLSLHRAIIAVENLDFLAANHGPVAFVEIGDALRPRRHGQGVGSEIILPGAIADGQRSAHPRADDQIRMIAEKNGEGKGAGEARQDRCNRVLRRRATLHFACNKVTDDLGIGLALKRPPLRDQLIAQRLEILDDPVVDERHRPDDVRVRIADRRRTVRRPARVGDTGNAVKRIGRQLAGEIVELALGPPALQRAAVNRADACRIIAAIFEPLQPVEQPLRNVAPSDDPDNSAHTLTPPPCRPCVRGTDEPSR